MKRKGIALFLALTLLVFSIFVLAAPQGLPTDADRIFKFNIIGVTNEKDILQMEDNGSRIFVNLEGTSAISLIEGDDFAILDANGTTGNLKKDFDQLDIVLDDYELETGDKYYGALLQLMDPGLDPYVVGDPTIGTIEGPDVMSDYSIYIRSLGKPGGWASITTCAEVDDTALFALLPNSELKEIKNKKGLINPDAYASVEQVGQDITTRLVGRDKKLGFSNVTAELTTIVFKILIDLDGILETTEDQSIYYVRVPIFDTMLEGEYWEYDNHGLKLLQVWIYNNSTDVSEHDGTWNNEE